MIINGREIPKRGYKVPFRFKGVHHCDAAILACVDFRFRDETMEYVKKVLGFDAFDASGLPGSSQAMADLFVSAFVDTEVFKESLAVRCVAVPADLHKVKYIVLVHHQDCGAYGGSERFQHRYKDEQRFHEGELRLARRNIRLHYPEPQVVLVYVRIVDDGHSLEFCLVE